MQITKEIDGVPLTCGDVADVVSSKLVLDSATMQLVQTSVNYTSHHGVSNVTIYRAADVAQPPYVEVTCFHDVVDIILECEGGVQRYTKCI